MEKLTRKQLNNLAKDLKGFYCGGNVYNHESIVQYIASRHFEDLEKYVHEDNQVKKLIDYLTINTSNLDNFMIFHNQIAYSCGLYGNTGQLARYEIYDTTDKNDYILKDVFFTYYC